MSHGFEGRDSKRFIDRRHHEQRAISKQSGQRGMIDRIAFAKKPMILDAAAERGRNTQIPGPDDVEAACGKAVMDCRKRIQKLPAAFAREVDADEEHVLSAVILVRYVMRNLLEINTGADRCDTLKRDLEVLDE